jgi:Protein of unknown function (DUF3168)
MSDDPSLAIQVALVARAAELTRDAVAGRVYDDVPAAVERIADTGADFPYISIADGQLVPIDEECFDRSTTFINLNVWSRAIGYPEAKRIAGALRIGLHEQDLAVAGHILDRMRVENITFSRDPDGVTRRARLELSVETQPAD